jgi:inhibitor of nuclear factor kappa-B kinase subunit alpha
MIWCGVSKKGKLPLVFIEPGTKIDAKYYKENVLEKVLKPEAKKLYGKDAWVFQQDFAPAHKSKLA